MYLKDNFIKILVRKIAPKLFLVFIEGFSIYQIVLSSDQQRQVFLAGKHRCLNLINRENKTK